MNRSRLVLAGLLTVLGIAGPLFPALAAVRPTAVELPTLVPDDAGLVVELEQLAPAVQAWIGSPLVQRTLQMPHARSANENLLQGLGTVDQQLREIYRGGIARLAGELFGGQALLAVWPAAASNEPGGVMLVLRDRNSLRLAELIDQFAAAQPDVFRKVADPQAGKNLVSYRVDRPHVAEPTSIVVLRGEQPADGSLAVVATHAAALKLARSALEIDATTERSPSLAELQIYRTAVDRCDPDATARVFLNPRPWDELLRSQPLPTNEQRLAIRQGFMAVWKGTNYLVGSVRLKNQVECELYWDCPAESLPRRLQRISAALQGSSTTVSRVPADACLVASGRFNLGNVVRAWLVDHPEERPSWFKPEGDPGGWALAATIASAVGPDVMFAVLPAVENGARAADRQVAAATVDSPTDWVLALGTQAVSADANALPLSAMVNSLAPAWAQMLARAAEIKNPETAVRMSTAEVEMFGLVHQLQGFDSRHPTRALVLAAKGETLWGTDAVEQLQRVSNAERAQSAAWLEAHPRLSTPSHLLFVNAAQLRKLYDQDDQQGDESLPVDSEIDRVLRKLLPALASVDTILIRACFDQSGAGVAVQID